MTERDASVSLALTPRGRLESLYGHTDRRVQQWIGTRRHLAAQGIDEAAEFAIRRKRCGYFFGLERVSRGSGETFDFDEGGDWQVILPELQGGEIVDLVAFPLLAPHLMASLRGSAAILGEEELVRLREAEELVPVWEHPLSWLKSGCTGAVVVNFHPPPAALFGARLMANTVALAEKLERALTAPAPEILFDEEAA